MAFSHILYTACKKHLHVSQPDPKNGFCSRWEISSHSFPLLSIGFRHSDSSRINIGGATQTLFHKPLTRLTIAWFGVDYLRITLRLSLTRKLSAPKENWTPVCRSTICCPTIERWGQNTNVCSWSWTTHSGFVAQRFYPTASTDSWTKWESNPCPENSISNGVYDVSHVFGFFWFYRHSWASVIGQNQNPCDFLQHSRHESNCEVFLTLSHLTQPSDGSVPCEMTCFSLFFRQRGQRLERHCRSRLCFFDSVYVVINQRSYPQPTLFPVETFIGPFQLTMIPMRIELIFLDWKSSVLTTGRWDRMHTLFCQDRAGIEPDRLGQSILTRFSHRRLILAP